MERLLEYCEENDDDRLKKIVLKTDSEIEQMVDLMVVMAMKSINTFVSKFPNMTFVT
ncbi:MAG: hypothetical protein FWF94_05105 [Oscillospiraceae bacterium]|nr:hypothetical protein [Oscillospiraceae bacterium]